MTAVSAEEGSLSSKRSWNLKAEMSFIYLNAGSAESAFGRTRLEARYCAARPHLAARRRTVPHDTRPAHPTGLTPKWSIQAGCDSWQNWAR
jgi:hypothetical protein